MDDWKKVLQWHAREQQGEKRKAREHLKRTCQAWPMIAIATIPFGWLAFVTLDPTLATFYTILVLIASVLVVEHLV
jgi:hypothetical protein